VADVTTTIAISGLKIALLAFSLSIILWGFDKVFESAESLKWFKRNMNIHQTKFVFGVIFIIVGLIVLYESMILGN
jgi:hypothetical protein